MKIILSKNVKWLGGVILGVCLLAVILLNVVGYVFDCKYISVFAAVAEVNKYEVRSELLMDTMNYVGVCCADDAAKVWAEGLKMRSAAMQYSVMNKILKAEYTGQLEDSFPNWVTGMSSPWIDSYQVVRIDKPSDTRSIFELKFSTATSTGPAGDYKAVLTVDQEGELWRISKIILDTGLAPYTGFKPKS